MRILFCLKGAALVRRASILLVVLALLAGMVGCVNGVENEFAGGSGTAGDPYQVGDWHHLDNVRHRLDAHFVLVNDLDSTTAGYSQLAGPEANEGNGWEPIGAYDGPFMGILDGQGHKISDLFVGRLEEDYSGLFAAVGEAGVIAGVGLVNSAVSGALGVGGAVGYSEGAVMDSYSTGAVTGAIGVGGLVGANAYEGTVTNSYSAASVTGGLGVGGLVGMSGEGTVSKCYSTGNVSGDWATGGLVGSNEGTVSNCYSTGTVGGGWAIGGLVGHNGGTVRNCYSSGNVTGENDVGGLVGFNEEDVIGQDDGIVGDSFWDVETSGTGDSYGGTGKTTAEMMGIATFADIATEGLDEPWDMAAVEPGDTNPDYTWNIVDGETYPFLSWESFA